MAETHVSSLVVRARPVDLDRVRSAIAALPHAEIWAADEAGRLVVVLETSGTAPILDTLAAIHALPGVLSATLVYHRTEPGAAGQEAGSCCTTGSADATP